MLQSLLYISKLIIKKQASFKIKFFLFSFRQETDVSQWNIKAFDRNFGRSLLASYTDHYMSDFVLHGTSDSSFKSQLLHDLQMTVQVDLFRYKFSNTAWIKKFYHYCSLHKKKFDFI